MHLLLSRLLELSYSHNPWDLLWEIVPFCVFLLREICKHCDGAVTHIKQVHLHSKDIYLLLYMQIQLLRMMFLKKRNSKHIKHVTIFPTIGYYDEHTIMLPQFNFHGLNRIFLVSRKIIHLIEFCPVFAPR